MSLLYPSALWLLLAIPVLFLARRRHVQLRAPVANLYLWRAASPSGALSLASRLRRHRSWLLQAAFLVALIASLARPLVSMGRGSIVVVLDASLSMGARDGGQTRLDTARTRAASLVEDLPWGTLVRVISAQATPLDLGAFRPSDQALQRALAAIRPSSESADLARAIQQARASDPTPARIHVFTDLAPPALAGAEAGVIWSVVGEPLDNAAITALGVGGQGQQTRAVVAVTNYGASEIRSTVALAQGGQVIAREPIEIAPRSSVNVFSSLAGTAGTVTARLELEDALPADNERFVIVRPTEPVRVLLVGGGFFLEKALRAHPGYALTIGTSVDRAQGGDGGSYDVIVCEGCPQLPEGSAGVLLLQPSSDRPDTAPVARIVPEHPLLDAVDVDGLSVAPLATARDTRGGTVIASARGAPVVVAYESATRRVVEWRFDAAGGALPLSTAFPLLVENAVDWLSAPRRNPVALVAGSPLRWLLAESRDGNDVSVTGPDGRNVPAGISDAVLTVAQTSAAGEYRVRAGGGERTFVVNPATEQESDLRSSRAVPVQPALALERGAGPVVGLGGQNEITGFLLVLALLLLAIEWRYRHAGLRQG